MKNYIESGKAVLGIEFGSTRIKAVLIGEDFAPIAQGAFDWENRLENGIWTYHMDEVWHGLQSDYSYRGRDFWAAHGKGLRQSHLRPSAPCCPNARTRNNTQPGFCFRFYRPA